MSNRDSLPELPSPDFEDGWEQHDFLSQDEERNWPNYDEISKAKKANKLIIHKVFGYIIPFALSLAFLAFALVLGVYVLHLILPENCRWLSPTELQNIHNMVFSSVAGGAVAIFAKIYFLDGKPN